MAWINSLWRVVLETFCFHRKFLVFNLVQRNLKLKYRQSKLGLLWTILIPAASAVIYYFVFQHVMRVKLPHYLLFIISGVWPWSFFALALSSGLESIVANSSLISKVPLPLHVFTYSETLTGFINFLLGIPVLATVFIISGAPVSWALLALPVYFLILFIQAYSCALILSVLFVFFRDLRHVVSIVLQMWFYATPILYSSEMIPENGRILMWLNPVALIFEGLHQALIYGGFLSAGQWGALLGWTAGLFIVGVLVSRMNRSFLVEVI